MRNIGYFIAIIVGITWHTCEITLFKNKNSFRIEIRHDAEAGSTTKETSASGEPLQEPADSTDISAWYKAFKNHLTSWSKSSRASFSE